MDDFPLPTLLVAAAVLLLGLLPLGRLVIASRKLRRHITLFPKPVRPISPTEISPLELAYLAGGSVRVGEVVLMDLLLSGRVRVRPGDGRVTLAGSRRSRSAETDPVRRAALSLLRSGVWMSAGRFILGVTASDAIDDLRYGSVQRGLLADSEETTRSVQGWYAARKSLKMFLAIGWVVAIVCVSAQMALENESSWALAGAWLGVALGVIWFLGDRGAARILAPRVKAKGEIIPHTTAGTELLVQALDSHQLTVDQGLVMSPEVALRYCAIHGLKRLSRSRAPSRRNAGSVGEGPEGEGFVTWSQVCDLVGACGEGERRSVATVPMVAVIPVGEMEEAEVVTESALP